MDQGQDANKAVEVPVWEHAHRTLDQIADDMRSRLTQIEHEQARLGMEFDALRSVLNRIAPTGPQPVGGYAVQTSASATPNSYRY